MTFRERLADGLRGLGLATWAALLLPVGLAGQRIQPLSSCTSNCPPSIVITNLTFTPVSRPVESGPYTYTFTVSNGIANSVGRYEIVCEEDALLACETPTPASFNLSSNQTRVVTVGYSTLGVGTATQRHIIYAYPLGEDDIPADVDTVEAVSITVAGAPLATHLTPLDGGNLSADAALAAAYSHPSGIITATVRLYVDGFDRTSAAVVTGSGLTATAVSLNVTPGTHTWQTYACANSGRCDMNTTTFLYTGPPPAFALDDSLPVPRQYTLVQAMLGGLPLPPVGERGCPLTKNHPEAQLSPGKVLTQPNPDGWVFPAGVHSPDTDSMYFYGIYADHVPSDPWPTCSGITWAPFNWNYWIGVDSTSPLWDNYPYSDADSLFASGAAHPAPFYAQAWQRPRPTAGHESSLLASLLPGERTRGGAQAVRRIPFWQRSRGRGPAGAAMVRLDPGAIKFTSLQVQLNGVTIVANGQPVRAGVVVDTVGYWNGRGGVRLRVPPSDTLLHQYDLAHPSWFQGGWNEVRLTISDSSNTTTTVRSRFVVITAGGTTSIALKPMRNLSRQDQGDCPAFGLFQCGSVFVVQSVPGFTSRDKPRNLNLVYRSSSQRTKTVIPVLALVSALQRAPDSFRVTPREGGTVVGTILRYSGLKGAPSGQNVYPLNEYANERRALGVEIDSSPAAAASRAITVEVKHYYQGVPALTDTVTQQVIQAYLTDSLATRFGPGWQLAELSRLVSLSSWQGAAQLLWLSGDGSYSIFRKPASTWLSPPGETASLREYTSVTNPDSARFIVRFDNGTRIGYRLDGWIAWTSDLVGNRTSFTYVANAAGRIRYITDPNGTRFELGYAGGDGYVDTISVKAPGLSARRVATLSYAGGRLTGMALWQASNKADTTKFGYRPQSLQAFLTTITDPRDTLPRPIVTTIEYDTLLMTPSALTLPTDNWGLNRQLLYRDVWRRTLPRIGWGRGLTSQPVERTLVESQLLGTSVSPAKAVTDFALDPYNGPTFVRNVSPGDTVPAFFGPAVYYRHNDRDITRDSLGRVVKIVHMRDSAALADSVMYTYDASSRVVKVRRASLQYPRVGSDSLKPDSLLFTYDSVWADTIANPGSWCSRLLTSTDPMGGVTTVTYGTAPAAARCRPIQIVGPALDTTRFVYGSFGQGSIAGRPLTVSDPTGAGTTVTYATATWNTETVTRPGLAGQSRVYYSALGRPDSIIDPGGNRSRFWYDSLGRVTYQKAGVGDTVPVTRTVYGRSGLPDSIFVYRSAAGNDTARAASPAPQVTRYFYDRLGQVDSILGSGGRRQWFQLRNAWGVPMRTYTGNGAFTAAEVNWQGKVSIVANSPLTPAWSFDGKAFATGSDLAAYNAAGPLEAGQLSDGQNYWYKYNAKGQLIRSQHQEMDSAFGSTRERQYSRTGQLLRETLSAFGGAGIVRTYQYNARGQRTVAADTTFVGGSIATNGIGRIDYSYNAAGQLVAMIGFSGSSGTLTEYARASYYYGRGGRLDSLNVRPGVGAQTLRTRFTYDTAGRTVLSRSSNSSSVVLASENVTSYSAVDDVLQADVATPTRSSATRTYTYSADGSRRLLSEADSWDQSSTAWRYDVFGNRIRQLNSLAISRDTSTYDLADNRLRWRSNGQSASGRQAHLYWYDQAGNRIMTTDSLGFFVAQETRMSYTAANQLAWSLTHNEPGSNSTVYTANWHWYDAEGVRIATEVAPAYNPGYGQQEPGQGSRFIYFYDGSDVALMLVKTGSNTAVMSKRFLTGGLDRQLAVQVYAVGSASNYAIIADRRGTVLGAMRTNGQLESNVNSYTTNAFGAVTATSGAGATNLDLGFTGASSSDPKAGFTYLRNRWYDPLTGRFLTQDPIGLAGGINLYSYAGNNPVSFSDPYGLKAQCLPFCLAPLLVGAGALAAGISQMSANIEAGEGVSNGVATASQIGALMTAGNIALDAYIAGPLTATAAGRTSGVPAGVIDARDVAFSQNSIKASFQAGGSVDDLAAGLSRGQVNPTKVPPLRVIVRAGRLVSLDNRRLAAGRLSRSMLPYRMASEPEILRSAGHFTSTTDGTSVVVRGTGEVIR